MDHFDRLLELHLRRKLDPLVAAPVPVRRGRAESGRPGRPRHDPDVSQSMAATTDPANALALRS
jgi:hypothetical protein